MGGSLQDQLLKSGLVTEQQIETARTKPKPADNKRRGKGQNKSARAKSGDGARNRRPNAKQNPNAGTGQARPKKAATPQKVDKNAPLDPQQRALRDKVHAMIADSTEVREGGETPYHFVKGSRVKRIYVTEPQRDRLASNELAVAAMKGKHFLIPMTVANEVKALIPGYFIAMGSVDATSTDAASIDDEYADFQVPDDLMW
jgi:uncharacterized protein